MTYVLLVALFLLPFAFSTDCPSTYKQNKFVLQNNVVTSSLVRNQNECTKKCSSHMGCYSVNYYHQKKMCQLNKATHLSSPVDLVYDVDGTYIRINDRTKDVCSDKYCSDGQICVMNKETQDVFCRGG